MTRIVLADEHALVRAGLRALLADQRGIQVVAEASDGPEAVRLAAAADVVLLDLGRDGIEVTRRIVAAHPRAKVVIVTTINRVDHLRDALQAGATGYLLKDTDPGHLARAVRSVASGGAQLAPQLTRHLLDELSGRLATPPAAPHFDGLTHREHEIMRLVVTGLTNETIAARLTVSPATIKTHVSRILTKTGVANRAQLVHLAYETGVLRPRWL